MVEENSGCSDQRYMGGITTQMKRIIDIDKLQEAQQRQKNNYWQRIKNDSVKFGHYKEWRKQYVNKKKEKETQALSPSPIVIAAVPFEKVRENIISQITDLMCRVDWQDHELRNVWTALENLRSLLPAAEKGAA
jgi:menaquinone-dependent protoporphyrinogen IX oxidase